MGSVLSSLALAGIAGVMTLGAAAPRGGTAASFAAPPQPIQRAVARSALGAAVPAEQATAATVLRHAATAYRSVQSLRADFVQHISNPLLGSSMTSRGTLYERRPDRLLLRFSQPAGDLIVADGRSFWVYYPSVDPKQVIRSPATAAGAGGVDLQSQFVGDPVARFNATLHGREDVDGRSAYVVAMIPKHPTGYRSLKVWIDARDWLARRFEITEESGVIRRFDLTNLHTNVPLKDSLFQFTPPAGAHVIDRG